MKRWFILVVIVFGTGGAVRSAQARTDEQLYKVDRPARTSVEIPGTPVPGLAGVRLLTSPSQQSLLTVRERQSLQRNMVYHSLFTPNDPQFSLQWNLQAMNVPAAWDVDQTPPVHGGDPRIIVAVLDTGLASTLVGGAQSVPDIAASSIWTNTKEIAGDGIDNDGDGYVDDVHGWNFVANSAKPADDNGHGTHISGVIAAATDNNIATAGIASAITIMPLKVLDKDGLGSTLTLTKAVNYAVQHGASIINLSLGGDENDPIFHQAIQAAVQQGVVVISAAGNTGVAAINYPARYSEVISVGATNADTTKAAYSNYGAGLTVVAPGGDTGLDLNADGQPDGIPSQTCADASCTSFSTIYLAGTSQAASEVSGIVALMESCGAAPGNIEHLLTASAHDLGAAGRDDVFGFGLVDAAAAVTAAGCVTAAPTPPGLISAVASKTSLVPIVSKRPAAYVKPVFSWSGQSGATYVASWKNGTTTVSQARQTNTTFSPAVTTEGTYTLSVATVDALGQISTAVSFVYRYQKPIIAMSNGSSVDLLNTDLKIQRTITTKVGNVLSLSAGSLGITFSNRLLAAAQPNGSVVTLMDTTGKTISTVQPFGPKFFGSISTAIVQLADGTSQFIAGTKTDGASIAWYSSNGQVIGRNLVFGNYTGGLNIATADLNGDGNDEVIVAEAAGPEMRIYSAKQQRVAVLAPRGQRFKQGWSITAGDTSGDGRAEIIVTPNIASGTAKVLVLDGAGSELRHWTTTGSTSGPMLLQAIDLSGDGRAEIISVPQRGGGVLQQLSAAGKVLKQVKLQTTTARSLARL